MKAIELLKEYKSIDFGCDVEELHNNIDEAIKELEEYKTNYQGAKQRLDSTVIALAVLKNENNSLVKTLMEMSGKMNSIKKRNCKEGE